MFRTINNTYYTIWYKCSYITYIIDLVFYILFSQKYFKILYTAYTNKVGYKAKCTMWDVVGFLW